MALGEQTQVIPVPIPVSFSIKCRLEGNNLKETHTVPLPDWSQCPEGESIPGKVSGARVFRVSRIRVKLVFGNPGDGLSIDRNYRAAGRDGGTNQGRN
jgi:hypothetical protein